MGVATPLRRRNTRLPGYSCRRRPASAQQPRLDPGLGDGAVGLPLDEVRRGARAVGDGFDQLGAFVDQADAVVGGVRGGQVTLLDQALQQRPALVLAVVVDAV